MGKQNKKNQQSIKKNTWLLKAGLAAALIIVCFLLYSKTSSYKLIYFDDDDIVGKYAKVIESGKDASWCFSDMFGGVYYRPVLSCSFYQDSKMHGNDFSGFYRTNQYLHVLAVLLLFFVLLKLGFPLYFAFLSSLLAAVHPVLTPAVAWIAGRNDTLLTIFALASFYFLLRFQQKEENRWLSIIFQLLFFLLAMFTKESAIVLPFLFIIYFLLFNKDLLKKRETLILYAGWILIPLLYYFARLSWTTSIDAGEIYGVNALALNYPSIFAITGKLFFPLKMNGNPHFESFTVITGIVILLGFSLLIFLNYKELNLKKLLFYGLWYFAFLLPTLFVRLDNPHFDYLEHRAYILIFSLFPVIFEILKAYKVNINKSGFYVVSTIIICLLFYKSSVYSDTFSDRKAFQSSVIEMYPENYTGYYNLGKAVAEEGNYNEAERLYRKAIELKPDNKNIYIYLSSIFLNRQLSDSAEHYMNIAYRLDSSDAYVNWNVGKVYLQKKDTAQGLRYLENAVGVKLPNRLWFAELGLICLSSANYLKAAEYLDKSIKFEPDVVDNYINAGVAYFYSGNAAKAEQIWSSALEKEPNSIDVRTNLLELYIRTNQLNKAKSTAEEIISLGGNVHPETKIILGL